MTSDSWHIYIVKCSDDSLYTGIAKDVDKRISQHNEGKLGAKYTKSRRPVIEVYRESAPDRSAASKREYQIKQLSRKQKLALTDQPIKP